MSIMHEKELSLQQLIEKSDLVLEVEFIEEYTEKIMLESKEDPKKKIPPFLKKGCVFRTGKVLKNSQGITVPEIIKVPNENWHRFLSQHKEQYLNGPSKSYLIEEYITEVASMKEATVLFLYHFQGTYDLAARGAFESDAALEKIELLLKATKRSR